MLIELRLLLIVSSVFSFLYIVSRVKNSKMRVDDSVFWIISSLFFVVISIYPSILIGVANVIGFESAANLVFLLVVGVVFLKLFILSVKLSILTEKNSQLVQYVSILEKNIADQNRK